MTAALVKGQRVKVVPDEPPVPTRRECRTLKCGVCGRFTRRLHLVWTGGAVPEPDHEAGDCCLRPNDRTRP